MVCTLSKFVCKFLFSFFRKKNTDEWDFHFLNLVLELQNNEIAKIKYCISGFGQRVENTVIKIE